MFKSLKRWWKYLTAKSDATLDEKADPKVQLEQAITEAQDQHRRLAEQAANVIANQKQTEMRLHRQMSDHDKLAANTKQAVLMADEATKAGDTAKATEYTNTAQTFATQLITLEAEIEESKAMALQCAAASDQAKQAVSQNAAALQQKLSERHQLLSQLDQAKMQEQMNTAMASISETVGQDTPSIDEVRDKIEARYAKAKGMSELSGQDVQNRMLEVEAAATNTEADARLSEIRSQLGLASDTVAEPVAVAAAEPQAVPA